MAEEHHDDHGNTPAAWFLTISFLVVWTIGAVMIILGGPVVLWSVITFAASAVCAIIAGVMKTAGLGRKTPRVAPIAPSAAEAERIPEARPQEAKV